MFEKFILKACKSFWRRVDTIIEKILAILKKITDSFLGSYFVCSFFQIKINLVL